MLLRNFVDPTALLHLKEVLTPLYDKIGSLHIFAHDLENLGLPHFHEYVFTQRHETLLKAAFQGFDYTVFDGTSTRRIDASNPEELGALWMPPLGPHIDAYFHVFEFTVNFWVPLQPCGADAPGLGAVCTSFDEVLRFTGYDGNAAVCGDNGIWNSPNFNHIMRELDEWDAESADHFFSTFADRIITPTYELGDAMMLSNWTLHFTHVAPGMQATRRENVELRFWCGADLATVRARAAAAG